jgi:hypothetical protein
LDDKAADAQKPTPLWPPLPVFCPLSVPRRPVLWSLALSIALWPALSEPSCRLRVALPPPSRQLCTQNKPGEGAQAGRCPVPCFSQLFLRRTFSPVTNQTSALQRRRPALFNLTPPPFCAQAALQCPPHSPFNTSANSLTAADASLPRCLQTPAGLANVRLCPAPVRLSTITPPAPAVLARRIRPLSP